MRLGNQQARDPEMTECGSNVDQGVWESEHQKMGGKKEWSMWSF